jgi:hypothetical protein
MIDKIYNNLVFVLSVSPTHRLILHLEMMCRLFAYMEYTPLRTIGKPRDKVFFSGRKCNGQYIENFYRLVIEVVIN